jgi:hypothetical protein
MLSPLSSWTTPREHRSGAGAGPVPALRSGSGVATLAQARSVRGSTKVRSCRPKTPGVLEAREWRNRNAPCGAPCAVCPPTDRSDQQIRGVTKRPKPRGLCACQDREHHPVSDLCLPLSPRRQLLRVKAGPRELGPGCFDSRQILLPFADPGTDAPCARFGGSATAEDVDLPTAYGRGGKASSSILGARLCGFLLQRGLSTDGGQVHVYLPK